MKEKYLQFDEFLERIVNLPDDESVWELNCENDDDGELYTLCFSKHKYVSCAGNTYPFVVYSYPFTPDAGFIQETDCGGWEENVEEVWNDITDSCGLRPLK